MELIESFKSKRLGEVNIWRNDKGHIFVFIIWEPSFQQELRKLCYGYIYKAKDVIYLHGSIQELVEFNSLLGHLNEDNVSINCHNYIRKHMTFEEYCAYINQHNY